MRDTFEIAGGGHDLVDHAAHAGLELVDETLQFGLAPIVCSRGVRGLLLAQPLALGGIALEHRNRARDLADFIAAVAAIDLDIMPAIGKRVGLSSVGCALEASFAEWFLANDLNLLLARHKKITGRKISKDDTWAVNTSNRFQGSGLLNQGHSDATSWWSFKVVSQGIKLAQASKAAKRRMKAVFPFLFFMSSRRPVAVTPAL